ncbi:MAG: PEP-CTERM sorting domain-containing protein [Planctomycetia bacterium]|nr:PEP-CTERM sorting domain-containing protein [Planctomycetia bacterium]
MPWDYRQTLDSAAAALDAAHCPPQLPAVTATPPPEILHACRKDTAIEGGPLGELQAILDADKPIVAGGWMLAASGYLSSNPVYLSFDVGPGCTPDELAVWRYSRGTWSKCSPADLTCNGGCASFTVTGFEGYAVAVPEPATLALLAAGFANALAYGLRLRKKIAGKQG